MCLACRAKIELDAEVELHVAASEPRTTPLCRFGRFGELGHAERSAVKRTRPLFFALRHRELHVIDAHKRRLVHPARVLRGRLGCLGEASAMATTTDIPIASREPEDPSATLRERV